MLTGIEALGGRLHSLAAGDAGRVRVAPFASANAAFVPAAFRTFRDGHPGVELSLLSQRHPIDSVAAGTADIALVTGWDLPAGQDGVEVSLLFEDSLQVALAVTAMLATMTGHSTR